MKILDQLTYTYNGNRLVRVDDSATGVMVVISGDDGKGYGKTPENSPQHFREYGGVIREGQVEGFRPGDVVDPRVKNKVTINLPDNCSTFHSHPSGHVNPREKDVFDDGTSLQIGALPAEGQFLQAPSQEDKENFGRNNYTHYVFGKANGKTYICQKVNGKVVQATVPTSAFINIRK